MWWLWKLSLGAFPYFWIQAPLYCDGWSQSLSEHKYTQKLPLQRTRIICTGASTPSRMRTSLEWVWRGSLNFQLQQFFLMTRMEPKGTSGWDHFRIIGGKWCHTSLGANVHYLFHSVASHLHSWYLCSLNRTQEFSRTIWGARRIVQ